MDEARLFLALWPDRRLAAQFRYLGSELHHHCGGRRMPVESMHLTLAFLGATPRERIPELCEAMGKVAFLPFFLRLSQVGHWQPGIVWLGGDVPAELDALATSVRDAMTALGMSFDRKRFKPHITLLRNARRAWKGNLDEPLSWSVDQFVLVESVTLQAGARYQVLAHFPARQG